MKNNEVKNTELTQEAISKRAYELYLARGCEEGHAEEDWHRAESELKAKMAKATKTVVSGTTPRASAPKAPMKATRPVPSKPVYRSSYTR